MLHDIDAIIVKLPMRDLMTQQILLTPSDVAKRLQMNERTVTQWLRNGHLRGFKIGKEWRISDVDLDAFIEASANIPSEATANRPYGSLPRSVA
jgi:excisionase family DNA binding protein